jgi:hypothetical protein
MSNDIRKYIFLAPQIVLATLTTNARLSLSPVMETDIGDHHIGTTVLVLSLSHERKIQTTAQRVPF